MARLLEEAAYCIVGEEEGHSFQVAAVLHTLRHILLLAKNLAVGRREELPNMIVEECRPDAVRHRSLAGLDRRPCCLEKTLKWDANSGQRPFQHGSVRNCRG